MLLAARAVLLLSLATFVYADAKEDMESIKPVVGIDLGTTYSCVGYFRNGRVEIIQNEQGNRITPSYVAFTAAGERLIGDPAKNQLTSNPENTVFDSKRLIGRSFSDPAVQKDIKLWPFKVTELHGKPHIVVKVDGKDKQFSPEEISAMVLYKMKQIAEEYLETNVTHAIVTVPAYFNDAQRQSTKDAGAISGLTVLRIINEPTAAAIAYGFNKKEEEQNILVFDLGGGTFDVSLLTIDHGVFEVLATAGDTHLGGQDFDNRVTDYVINEIKKQSGKDVTKNVRAVQKIRREAEKAKRTLSKEHQTTIEFEDLLGDGSLDVNVPLSRAKFNELNMDLFQSTIVPVEKVLKDGDMKKEDIHEVIMVGGSTRIIKIQQLVKQFFNNKALNRGINPDEAVAYGAAVQAGILTGDEHTQELVLLDVIPLTLGIETMGGIMTKILPRNSPIPTTKSQIFSTVEDNQERVTIMVYEGERELAKKNNLLGQFDLKGIPPAPHGQPQIEVTFEIDTNGILKVTAEDKATGNKNEIKISNSDNRLSQEEIDRMIKDAEKYAGEDKEQKERIEAVNGLTALAYSTKKLAGDKEKNSKLSEEQIQKLTEASEAVLKWIEDNQSATIDEIKARKAEFEAVVHPITKELGGDAGSGSADSGSGAEKGDGEEHDEL